MASQLMKLVLLLKHGADITIKDSSNRMAISYMNEAAVIHTRAALPFISQEHQKLAIRICEHLLTH